MNLFLASIVRCKVTQLLHFHYSFIRISQPWHFFSTLAYCAGLFFVGGGVCLLHWMMFTNMSGPYPLDASTHPVMRMKNAPHTAKSTQGGGQNHPCSEPLPWVIRYQCKLGTSLTPRPNAFLCF